MYRMSVPKGIVNKTPEQIHEAAFTYINLTLRQIESDIDVLNNTNVLS